MRKAHLLTIGTEITSGEIINTNAAWVAQRLEHRGERVISHAVVRDHREEILHALENTNDFPILIVTGGLGPTTDDLTRACVAEHFGLELEFDEQVWQKLNAVYSKRGLPLREAHRHQCYFPKGSERLENPVGTALGFYVERPGQQVFVLPGPPRELQSMWLEQVEPRLRSSLNSHQWFRWTCLGAPESEVAELVEAAGLGLGLELGYRASVPYVFVKAYLNASESKHQEFIVGVEKSLAPYIVVKGEGDLAEELLRLWPSEDFRVCDLICGAELANRLFFARANVNRGPTLVCQLSTNTDHQPLDADLILSAHHEELRVQLPALTVDEKIRLPYRIQLGSERGRKSAAEWAIWLTVKALRASSNQA